jgi:hypothetical protein
LALKIVRQKELKTMYQIKRARKDKQDGTVIHEIAGQPDKVYTDIRVGISWPKESAPGYFCMVGERFQAGPMKKRSLVLLREFQSNDLQELFRVLTDWAVELGCGDSYADLRPENECYVDAFSNFRSENMTGEPFLFIGQASWLENFQFGTILIRDRMKSRALEIDRETIVAAQLGNLTETALMENPEVEFYAVNALRFVVGAFQKSPWVSPEPDELEFEPLENYPGYYFKFD